MQQQHKEKKENDKKLYQNILVRIRRFELTISTICIVAIFVCLYALRIEIYKERDSNYKALCDINAWISCSKVFTSKYGKGFGLLPEKSFFNQPNTIYGIIFYIIQLLCLLLRKNTSAIKLKLYLSVLSNLGTIYLAYILYFILNDFCIVCVSTYVLNFLLLTFNFLHYKNFKSLKQIAFEYKNNKAN